MFQYNVVHGHWHLNFIIYLFLCHDILFLWWFSIILNLWAIKKQVTDQIGPQDCSLLTSGLEGNILWRLENHLYYWLTQGFPAGVVVKNLPAIVEDARDAGGWEYSLEKEMQSTSVFLPGKFPGQRSLVGYSTWCHKESDMTEHLLTLKSWVIFILSCHY